MWAAMALVMVFRYELLDHGLGPGEPHPLTLPLHLLLQKEDFLKGYFHVKN
jgi:hypothetical protein